MSLVLLVINKNSRLNCAFLVLLIHLIFKSSVSFKHDDCILSSEYILFIFYAVNIFLKTIEIKVMENEC